MDEQQVNEYLKGAVEALLFISDKPVEIDQIKEALETVEAKEIKQLIKALQNDYEVNERGMMICEIAGGYQMLSNPQYAEFVRNFFKTRVKEKLSRPALEALSISAYRQPVSRADIEIIRGVNSDGVVTNLLEKGLIKVVGRKDVPGRPFLYGTTKLFLEYFGLKSLKDLPKIEDVSKLLGAQASEEGGGGSGSDLFDSNKALAMKDAVADFGGKDHLNESFVREGAAEMFEQEEQEEDQEERGEQEGQEETAGEVTEAESIEEAASEEVEGVSEVVLETDGAEKIEEPEDLKKAMVEMNCGDDPLEENGEDETLTEPPEEKSEVSDENSEEIVKEDLQEVVEE